MPRPARPRRRRGASSSPQVLFSTAGVVIAAGVFFPLTLAVRWPWLVAYALAVAVATFALYGYDKAAARSGGLRVPERTLHAFMFVGGTPGAFLGQTIFRHKTIKSSFRLRFWALVVLQLALVAWLIWWLGDA